LPTIIFAKKMGWNKVELEGDAVQVVQAFYGTMDKISVIIAN
jgi:hypothetical protein